MSNPGKPDNTVALTRQNDTVALTRQNDKGERRL
jgi:hypothetical protein